MKTPTHFAIGGVVPDLPIIMTFAALWIQCVVAGCGTSADVLALLRQLNAESLWLISAHNLVHSPNSIALLYLVTLLGVEPHAEAARAFLLGSPTRRRSRSWPAPE
jgi:hypothetical protein